MNAIQIEKLTAKVLETHPEIDRYQLSLAIAKRADELATGSPSKLSVSVKEIKPTDLALMEIAEGLVAIKGFVDKK
ncbi:DNA-directed RNA polymerase omega subunit [hydrothermal vent metagenome]|uniref:DNA-directed RNA polymerase omega subunit n=1 Tax=hydrothermal vent metagenome TaxID=652676 RepID=A0A1W1BSF0_9ZZZZ